VGERICSIDDCGRPHQAHGLCGAHNERRKSGLDLTPPIRQYERAGLCKVEGCGRPRQPRGSTSGHRSLCAMHRVREVRMRAHGLTSESLDRLSQSQKGRCAVCGTKDPGYGRGTLCIDHDHVTGQVRGLLCNTCNRAIGLLKDDPEVIAAAARYVQKHRQMALFTSRGA
jgi:hypothetical protein